MATIVAGSQVRLWQAVAVRPSLCSLRGRPVLGEPVEVQVSESQVARRTWLWLGFRPALGAIVYLNNRAARDLERPVDDIGVTAVASHESGETFSIAMQASGDQPGVFVGTLTPPRSGTWYFEAVAERNDEPIAVSRTSILHESGQAEFFSFRKNRGLLQRLSEATGGQYFEAGDLSGLPDLLRYSSSGITETEYRAIWDAPAAFLLLLMLKAGEWLLRRRWSSI